MTPNSLAEITVKYEDPESGGLIGRPLLVTSDKPSNIENVPRVTMIDGNLKLMTRRPLTKPSSAPKATPQSIASHGSSPAIINKAATTAEKLNIHPTDRS